MPLRFNGYSARCVLWKLYREGPVRGESPTHAHQNNVRGRSLTLSPQVPDMPERNALALVQRRVAMLGAVPFFSRSRTKCGY